MTAYRMFAIAGAAALLSAAMPAQAAVNYSEAVSGDIDTFTSATDALGQPTRNFIPLGAGTNIFTGTLKSGNPNNDSSDVIPFELLAGQTLTGLSVTISDKLIIQGSQIVLDSLYTNSEPINVSLGNYSSGPLTLGPGLYSLLLGNGVVVTGYQLSLDVTQAVTPPTGGVPEPATWAMMIGGFGLAGAAMRRRRSIAATA